ncbi:glycosyl hydrolase [Brachionus plicatilis]|uniref:Glycosyl hydrolase n=1 Tax=Brachionus plicatilis TaxID=10195 RepID=A0A3M7QI26_BRAPC|nr:glycosyl hydrolase [Brachionus plicatilis]
MKLFFIYLIVVISLKLSNSCEPPDCDRLDCGTCGNACCSLEFLLQPDPNTLNIMISSLLHNGGPDDHYKFVTSSDLRPYNISCNFILQGIHTTLVKKYNDTLNFAIFPETSQKYFQSRMRAFSISQIGGAYCDEGQNYKNLIYLIKNLNVEYIENHVAGCEPTPRR